MDSGNSDSLQSSSGGEDEFDSRAAAAAAVAMMNSSSNNHRRQEVLVGGRGGCGSALLINNGSISNQQPPLQLSSGMFVDSLSTATMASGFLFDSISRPFHHHGNNNNNSVLSLDMAGWSKSLRSDPNCTGNINNNDDGDNRNNNSGLLPSTSCSSSLQSLFVHQGQLQSPSGVSIPPPTVVVVPPPENSSTSSAATAAATVPDHQQPGTQTHAPRNPKKRSRASRRAPTTVLTTDTTNFRAMVQEFTGIPAPPFTAATSPFPRARILDLYGTPSSMRSNHHHHHLPLDNSTSQPTYLRRPFPQKVQLPPPPSPFLSSSSSSPSSSSQLSPPPPPPNATASAASPPPPLINYQQSSSLFNIPHPILTSLLQSNPSKPSHHHQIPSNDSGGLKISSFLDDDFGLGHVGSVNPTTTTATNTSLINNLPGLISSDQTLPSRHNINNENPPPQPQPPPTSSINWGGNGMMGSVHDHNDNDNARGTKLSFSTSVSTSSIFPSDKRSSTTDNAGTSSNNNGGGGGGMMESWICSSSE